MSETGTDQASKDKPINQHLVCLWQLQDIEVTIADAAPEELVELHSKLVALSTDITEAVQSAIRTEKLKLLAEVRERVVGKNSNTHWSACNNHGKGKPNYKCVCGLEAANDSRTAQMAALNKLEAEL